MEGPDFSAVDSLEKAQVLFRRGELEELFLAPLEFGGTRADHNILYVPIGIGAIKASTDFDIIGKLVEEGKVTSYQAKPRYAGKSFIPISIEIRASNPGEFVFTIEIWGEGLSCNQQNPTS